MSRKAKTSCSCHSRWGNTVRCRCRGIKQTYWNTSKTTQRLQFAWNATFRNVSLCVSVQRSASLYDDKKITLAMSLSVPLGNPAVDPRPLYHHPCRFNWHYGQYRRERYLPGRGEPVLQRQPAL